MTQENMFLNRLKKNVQRISKWAIRENLTAYRIYDKDIPQYPFIIDNYANSFVIYMYNLGKRPEHISEEEDQAKQEVLLNDVQSALIQLFSISKDQIFLKIKKRQKGTSQYEKLDQKSFTKIVREGEMNFIVNLSDYLDTGLFIDHRKTRQMIKKMSYAKTFLNLFAYTGSMSVAAAMGGAAKITTVDMSNTYLRWARNNFKLNKISQSQHEFLRENIISWLQDINLHVKRKYDIIFVDPPSFSNSKKMQESSFDIQRDHPFLINQCKKILADNGILLFSTNLRNFKMKLEEIDGFDQGENITKSTLPLDVHNEKVHQVWKFG